MLFKGLWKTGFAQGFPQVFHKVSNLLDTALNTILCMNYKVNDAECMIIVLVS